MLLSESIYDGGLIQEITRITGAGINVYTNKARIARLNNALDRYWGLLAENAEKGTTDDTNQTSLPVETQSLVSGTNSYKVSSFTNEVLQILRLSALNDDADEIDLVREEFDDIETFNELYSTDSDKQGTPEYWTRIGDYIYLRPCPDYSETNGLRAYVSREMSKFNFTSFTVTQATPAVFTASGHGLVAGDSIILETDGTLLTGLTADTVTYYIISAGLTTSQFEVSTTIGGTAVNTTSTQSGNHKYTKVSKEPGIPIVHHQYLAYHASLPYLIEKKLPQKNDIASLIQIEEQNIKKYWSQRDKDLSKRLELEAPSFM